MNRWTGTEGEQLARHGWSEANVRDVMTYNSSHLQVEHLPGSNFLIGQNNLSSAHNEEFNKMTNDPLLMMRVRDSGWWWWLWRRRWCRWRR